MEDSGAGGNKLRDAAVGYHFGLGSCAWDSVWNERQCYDSSAWAKEPIGPIIG